MLLEDSFDMSVMLVTIGLFLVVFGGLLVEYTINVYRNAYKRSIMKKFLIFVLLANLYVFTELLDNIQVSPIISGINMLNKVFGVILLALFCVFIYRNVTVHGGIARFNTLLVRLTLIFATIMVGTGFIGVVMGGDVMPGGIFRVTHCFTMLLFSVFGNLMILDFIINNRESVRVTSTA